MERGFELIEGVIDDSQADAAREELFRTSEAGTRCLLDHPTVRKMAMAIRGTLVTAGLLPDQAVAIQAIASTRLPARIGR